MRPKYILPLIVFSQFAGTSLWFAGNAVIGDLVEHFGLQLSDLGIITSSVQAGFIIGTLIFALSAVADRFSPSRVFFVCSIMGSLFNVLVLILPQDLISVALSRFFTGVMLAGIYPVGMKIAADWYENELGKAIGYLVGALVLGTALPNLLKAIGGTLSWDIVLISVSVLAGSGGLMVLVFIKDGPYRKRNSSFNPKAIYTLFRPGKFRASAFGYFGHMWELYTFWTFVPIILLRYFGEERLSLNIPFLSFLVVGIGAIGCIYGGLWSRKYGSAKVAWYNLLISGLCILVLPLLIVSPLYVFIPYVMIWGWTVVGDSAQFSALAATNAPKELVGSGLTIMNCIGFSLTIVSISLLGYLITFVNIEYAFLTLIPGPLFGLLSIYDLKNNFHYPKR